MATRANPFETPRAESLRLYTICFFDPGLAVPRVQLFEAATDSEATAMARSLGRFKMRELWDRHRLVAKFTAED